MFRLLPSEQQRARWNETDGGAVMSARSDRSTQSEQEQAPWWSTLTEVLLTVLTYVREASTAGLKKTQSHTYQSVVLMDFDRAE